MIGGLIFLFLILAPQKETQAVQVEQNFPLGRTYHPGRWFPVEFQILSQEDWKGEIAVVCEEHDSLSSRSVQCIAGKKERFWLPILLETNPGKLRFHMGDQHSDIGTPIPTTSNNLLILSTSEDYAKLWQLAQKESWALNAASVSELPPSQMPLDLYLLDSVDIVLIHENGISALPPGGMELLLRWANVRGRLMSTRAGHSLFAAKFPTLLPIEILGEETTERPLPMACLPPSLSAPLLARDFAQVWDLPVLVLFVYFLLLIFFLFQRAVKTPSQLALIAGLAALLQALPGVGWKNLAYRNANLIVFEDESQALYERAHPVRSTEKLERVQEELWIPESSAYEIRFHPQISTAFCEQGWKIYSVIPLGDRQLVSAPGNGLRNRLGNLDEVSWALGKMGLIGFREQLAYGDMLAPDPTHVGRPKLRRPLSDYLSAPWIQDQWLMGRFHSLSELPALTSGSIHPDLVCLLWFPRRRER